MKLKVIRESGLPVDPSKLEAYKEEWRELVDKVMRKSNKDMLRATALLARLEKILATKYSLIGEWEVEDTQEAWRSLLDEHGSIRLAAARENNSVVAVIMDQEEVMY